MTQISKQEFDRVLRDVQSLKNKQPDQKVDELEKRVKDLEAQLNIRSPLLQTMEDIGRVEAIFDIMVRSEIVTQDEITQYLDLYPQVWDAILQILIAKGHTTVKQFYCHLLAYHHMFKTYGLNPSISKVDLFEERIKFAEELEKMLEPLDMVGR